MKKRLGLLLGGCFLIWGIVVYPAYLLGGETQAVYSAVAVGLCLVPAVLTMLWAEWAFRQSPDMYLMMVMGGTAVRMFFVMGVGVALTYNLPYLQQRGFWFWVLAFYMITLSLEMVLLLVGRTKTGQS